MLSSPGLQKRPYRGNCQLEVATYLQELLRYILGGLGKAVDNGNTGNGQLFEGSLRRSRHRNDATDVNRRAVL